jgi:hypothetical protein
MLSVNRLLRNKELESVDEVPIWSANEGGRIVERAPFQKSASFREADFWNITNQSGGDGAKHG